MTPWRAMPLRLTDHDFSAPRFHGRGDTTDAENLPLVRAEEREHGLLDGLRTPLATLTGGAIERKDALRLSACPTSPYAVVDLESLSDDREGRLEVAQGEARLRGNALLAHRTFDNERGDHRGAVGHGAGPLGAGHDFVRLGGATQGKRGCLVPKGASKGRGIAAEIGCATMRP
jgi:hypothetical protein